MRRGVEHLPTCVRVSVTALAAERGEDFPEEFEGVFLMKCDPDCPNLARAIQRGRELAEEHGW